MTVRASVVTEENVGVGEEEIIIDSNGCVVSEEDLCPID